MNLSQQTFACKFTIFDFFFKRTYKFHSIFIEKMNRERVIVLVEDQTVSSSSIVFNCSISTRRRILQIVKYIAIFIFIAATMVTIFKVWNKSSSIDIVIVEEKASERADVQGETTSERPAETTTQRFNPFPDVKSNNIRC